MAPAVIKGHNYVDYVVICARVRVDLFNFKRAWNAGNNSENILKNKDDHAACASSLDLTLYNCYWYRGNGEQRCEESRFVSTVRVDIHDVLQIKLLGKKMYYSTRSEQNYLVVVA